MRFRGDFSPRARVLCAVCGFLFALYASCRYCGCGCGCCRRSAYLRWLGTTQRATCNVGQQLSIFSIWTVKLHANPIKLLTLRPISRRFSFCFAIYFNSFFVFFSFLLCIVVFRLSVCCLSSLGSVFAFLMSTCCEVDSVWGCQSVWRLGQLQLTSCD